MMWDGMQGVGWGMGMVHGVLWEIFLILGIVGLVWVVARNSGRGAAAAPPGEAALDVLKKRYARGEIGKDEYEEKKLDLAA